MTANSTPTTFELTKEQAMEMAIETCKAREAVFTRTEQRLQKRIRELETALIHARNAETERDRLAGDALAILSGAGYATPEKGYVAEPWMLAIDLTSFASQRRAFRDTVIDLAGTLAFYLCGHCQNRESFEVCFGHNACKALKRNRAMLIKAVEDNSK